MSNFFPLSVRSRKADFQKTPPGGSTARSKSFIDWNRAWLGLLTWLLLTSVAAAQKDTGTIVGTVKDSSGAIVADAAVLVTDVDHEASFETKTDVNGEFVAGPLKVGRYSVTVQKEGFKKVVAGPVVVNVQARVSVDVTLQVGARSETVTVTAGGDLQVETQTSDLGQIVDSLRATSLPLNGRNYAQLALLGAGVAPSEPGSRTETSYGFSSNGARALQNNYLLDGVDNNSNLGDVLNGSAYVIQPSVDAIAEFKVQTNSYSAEFGRGNGAIMNAVIKSGTSSFHGDAYEFFRNDVFDANNAFDTFGKQQYQQNQFGGTIGGPIVKSKLFFFTDYEGLRIRKAEPQVLLIPSPQMRIGDFSGLLGNVIPGVADCSGNPTYQGEIFNSRLTQVSSLNSTGYCGVPIGTDSTGNPTNIFPTSGPSAINPVAQAIVNLFPPVNYNSGGNNYFVDPKKSVDQNNFDVRIDYNIRPNDSLFGRLSWENQPSTAPGLFNSYLDGGGFASGDQNNTYWSLAISETHLFRPTLINEFRFGYNTINSHRLPPYANTNVSGNLGLIGVPYEPGIGGLPSMSFSNDGLATIGSSDFLPSIEKQNSYVFDDNLSWVKGKHTLKFGTEIRSEEFTIFQPAYPRGSLTFGPDFTDNPGAPGTGGEDFASFLLGIPDTAQIVNLHNVQYHRNIFAFYAQDDIQVNQRLTLNVGVRYEMFRPITENNNEQGTFDFSTNTLILPKGQTAQLTPFLASVIPVQATASRGLIPPDNTDVAPRIGFAFKFTDKLVLRSGYGIFYGGQENGPFSNPSPGFNPPFFVTQSFNSPCGAAPVFPNANLSDPTNCTSGYNPSAPEPASLALNNFWTAAFPASSLSDPNSPLLYSLAPDLRTPLNQQWHLGVQYQLRSNLVAELSYAGSHGQRLYAFYNGNQLEGGNSGDRPFPALNNQINPLATFRSNAFSNYNSLQARLERNFSNGLQFEFSYTYSHALDDASSANLGSLNNGDFRDQTKPRWEYGNADFDVRHRFIVSYIYALPFGRGKAIGNHVSSFWDQVIGNWQVAGITAASTGNYATVSDPANPMSVDCGGTVTYNCARANRVGDPNGAHCLPGTFFNTCAFASNTGPAVYGDAGRNIVRGPGFQEWDISLLKVFPIREQMQLQFRAEFFNAFNHPNLLWGPIGALGQVEPVAIEVGTPQFGFPQAARDPRLIQFALKFLF